MSQTKKASAVLLSGVPASQLAQPWRIIGGNPVGYRRRRVCDVDRRFYRSRSASRGARDVNDVCPALRAPASGLYRQAQAAQ